MQAAVLTDEQIAAIEARAERAKETRWPIAGEMMWSAIEARTILTSAHDVPALLAEVKRLREALQTIADDLHRDDCWGPPDRCDCPDTTAKQALGLN